MTHGQQTKAFLGSLDARTQAQIVSNIAAHYQISAQDAFDEVTHDEAESVLDYMTDQPRPPAFTAEECCEMLRMIAYRHYMLANASDNDKATRLKACFEKMQHHLRHAKQTEPRS